MKIVAFLLASAPLAVSAFTTSLNTRDPSFLVLRSQASDEEVHKSEYQALVAQLAKLMDDSARQIKQMKSVATKIKDLETEDPQVTKLGAMKEEFAKALAEAKAADDVHGPNSKEAISAWDDAEKVSQGGSFAPDHPSYRYKEAAQGTHHMYRAVVDPKSLEEAVDAFGKIEHLGRLAAMESNRIGDILVGGAPVV